MKYVDKPRQIYPIELIQTGIYLLKCHCRRPIKGFYPYNAIRSMIIYTIEDFGDYWLPLNREYKPLGLSGYGEKVDYKEYKFLHIPKDMVDTSVLKNDLYFFDDATFPEGKNKKRYERIVSDFFNNKIDFSNDITD